MWISALHHNLESPHDQSSRHTHSRWRWPIGTLHHVYECTYLWCTHRHQPPPCEQKEANTHSFEAGCWFVCLFKIKGLLTWEQAPCPSTSVLKLMEINPLFAQMCKISGFYSHICLCACVLCICVCVCVCASDPSSPPCSLSPGRVLLLPYWEYDGLPLPLPAMS